MFGKKKKDSSSGILMPGSSGNPNEVNFSVLDAKSEAAPEKTTPAWEIPSKEVESRKTRRRRGRAIATGAIVIGCVTVVALVGIFTFRGLQHHLDYVGRLHEEISLISAQATQMDEFNTLVQDALAKPLSELAQEEQMTSFPDQEQRARTTTSTMNNAKREIEDLQTNLISPSDTEDANNAIAFVNAQQKITDIGSAYMAPISTYIEEYRNGQRVYDLVMGGDSDVRESVFLTGEPNDNNMSGAITLSESAIDKFKTAKDLVEGLQDRYPSLEPLARYLQLRIDAQYAAIETDNGYLEKDSAKMREANDRYNGLEGDASELVRENGILWPTDAVDASFNEMRANSTERASWEVEYPTWVDLRNVL